MVLSDELMQKATDPRFENFRLGLALLEKAYPLSKEVRMCVALFRTIDEIDTLLDGIVQHFVDLSPDREKREANYVTQKQLLEYLQLMQTGLKQFINSTDLPIEK